MPTSPAIGTLLVVEGSGSCPVAIAQHDPDGRGATRAVVWFADQVVSLGGEPLLVVPSRARGWQVPEVAHVMGSPAVRTVTHREYSARSATWTGGVVLAAWPAASFVRRLLEDRRTRAVTLLTDEPLLLPDSVSPTVL